MLATNHVLSWYPIYFISLCYSVWNRCHLTCLSPLSKHNKDYRHFQFSCCYKQVYTWLIGWSRFQLGIDLRQSIRLVIELDYKIGNSPKQIKTTSTSTSTLWSKPPIAGLTRYKVLFVVMTRYIDRHPIWMNYRHSTSYYSWKYYYIDKPHLPLNDNLKRGFHFWYILRMS